MKGNLLCPFIIHSFYLRRLDAGGEKLDEFGAVCADGVEGRGWFNKFAVAENCLRNDGGRIHVQIPLMLGE